MEPQFASLCVPHATKNKGAYFVVKLRLCIDSTETGRRYKEMSSWSIFNLDTKRWYNIVEDELPKGYDSDASAMDAGLVCTFRSAFTDEQRQTSPFSSGITAERQILVVSNPIERRIKVLPFPPHWYINLRSASLELVVDDVSQNYKVFLIRAGYSWKRGDSFMWVYESATNHVLLSPPMDPDEFGDYLCSAICQGVLYVLFSAPGGLVSQLFSYNFDEDEWEDTCVNFQKNHIIMLEYCDLMVSDNRLFLMTPYLVNRSLTDHFPILCTDRFPWPLDKIEISLADKACKTVFQ